MMLLAPHYRSLSDFGEEALDTTLSSLQRLYEAKLHAVELVQLKITHPDTRAETLWGGFVQECENTRREIYDHMANDFNTPGVLASVFNLVRSFNKVLTEPRASQTPAAIIGSGEFIKILEEELGGFMGLGRQAPRQLLERLNEIRAKLTERKSGGGVLSVQEIESLIQLRLEARKAKNYKESDRIRDELLAKGVQIKDGPQGTSWNYL
jgi:cysteinyl-tRNA synthetase